MKPPKIKQSENDVKKAIRDYLELNGWKVYRINNGGTYRGKGSDGKNKFSFAGDPGVPDLFCRKRGVLGYQMWIECKATGKKPSKEQQEFINDINSIPKGIAFWCDSFDRFLEICNDYIKGEIMRDLINHDDETTCPNCQGVGRVKKSGEEIYIANAQKVVSKVSDLTISELYELIIKAVRECKNQDEEKATIEYEKLTGKIVP